MARIERATSPLPRECSTTELHGRSSHMPMRCSSTALCPNADLPSIELPSTKLPSTKLRTNPGAGEGNRTLVVSLEGFCSTIELHPRATSLLSPPDVQQP